MFAELGIENYTAAQVAIAFGALLGLVFGALALVSDFCFRRAVIGPDQGSARTVWFTALATAIIGTQAAQQAGLIDLSDHRLLSPSLPIVAIILGGLLFGAGMVLTRGCISRLTVLTGTGNLRALICIAIVAIVAHSMMKGALSPLREALTSVTINAGGIAPQLGTLVLAGIALALAVQTRVNAKLTLAASLIGALVPLGWIGTGFVLMDEFDPIAVESISFTAPMTETLFWGIAATSIPATFGVGLMGGVVAGSFIAARVSGRFAWQSFETPEQTGRYFLGAVLMGVGGVLAGGCAVGAGLSGIPTLSIAAIIALSAMAMGAWAMNWALSGRGAAEFAVPPTKQSAQQAQ